MITFQRVDRIEAVFAPRDWPFARERRSEIATHWAKLVGEKPALFNGRVLVQYERRVEGGVLFARYLETDFATFIAWRDFGWPDREIVNGFAMAALRSRDDAFLLGEMGPHTANAGKVYFAAGTPDPDDVTPDGRLDLRGSAVRELVEETGLEASDITVGEGWTVVTEGQRMAFMRPVALDMDAREARALILSRLAAQERPELSDIRVVRGVAEIDRETMPPFICAYLEYSFANRE